VIQDIRHADRRRVCFQRQTAVLEEVRKRACSAPARSSRRALERDGSQEVRPAPNRCVCALYQGSLECALYTVLATPAIEQSVRKSHARRLPPFESVCNQQAAFGMRPLAHEATASIQAARARALCQLEAAIQVTRHPCFVATLQIQSRKRCARVGCPWVHPGNARLALIPEYARLRRDWSTTISMSLETGRAAWLPHAGTSIPSLFWPTAGALLSWFAPVLAATPPGAVSGSPAGLVGLREPFTHDVARA
jgi:hypothetical protein